MSMRDWQSRSSHRSFLANFAAAAVCLLTPACSCATEIKLKLHPQPSGQVSPLIFGQNQFYGPGTSSTSELQFPLLRFGGNATSRYNWQNNTTNTGKDWYYMNIPLEPESPNYVDAMIAARRSRFMINLPFIGWVAKSRQRAWAYSQKKYGMQSSVEPYDKTRDAGNGLRKGGDFVRNNKPEDTSQAIGTRFHLDWIKHLLKKVPEQRLLFVLGNEPTLWDESHRDLRYGDQSLPSPAVSYDELWQKTASLATAIKKAYPTLELAGPGSWGWCGYFSSGVDRTNAGGCTTGTDRAKHGDQELLAWYLQKSCGPGKGRKKPLIDYLDIHYYPEGLDQQDESPAGHQRRFASLRSLYDWDYTDPSWINQPVALLPRMQKTIAQNCPGTKLSISEYRFGTASQGISTALTQIAALGIFAEYGVNAATHFHELAPNSLLEKAFAIFLNYDGNGSSSLGGTFHRVQSPDPSFRSFAFKKDQRTYLYLINASNKKQTVIGLNAGKAVAAYELSAGGYQQVPGGALAKTWSQLQPMTAKLVILK